jgi:F-type H+-transporting ATPase subunit b
MSVLLQTIVAPLAAGEAVEGENKSFLVSPDLGAMIWTLIVFVIAWIILSKVAFPKIAEALDKRQAAINESIEAAERDRKEAEQLAAENRQNLLEARTHAEDILSRARKSADAHEAKAREDAKQKGEEILEQARKDIESETRRAISEIRSEVADLTILATAKVTGKTLDGDDQRRLIEDALDGLDFSALSGEQRR